MAQVTIVFPSKYDHTTQQGVDRAIASALSSSGWNLLPSDDAAAALSQLYSEPVDLTFKFDLSSTVYVALKNLAKLMTIGRFCHRATGRKVMMAFPAEARVTNGFMHPWGFFDYFHEWGDVVSHADEFLIHYPYKKAVPLTRIREFADVQSTARRLKKPRIEKLLRDNFGFGNDERNVFVDRIISEVCDNIPFHSQGEGFVAVQLHDLAPHVDTPAGYQPFIDIVITDDGIGILASLRKKHPGVFDRHSAARILHDVIAGTLPQPTDRARGGLSRVAKAVAAFGGLMEIQTPFGTATVKRSRTLPLLSTNPVFSPGTTVTIKLPSIQRD